MMVVIWHEGGVFDFKIVIICVPMAMNCSYCLLFFFFFIVVGFVIHWNESAMDLHVLLSFDLWNCIEDLLK